MFLPMQFLVETCQQRVTLAEFLWMALCKLEKLVQTMDVFTFRKLMLHCSTLILSYFIFLFRHGGKEVRYNSYDVLVHTPPPTTAKTTTKTTTRRTTRKTNRKTTRAPTPTTTTEMIPISTTEKHSYNNKFEFISRNLTGSLHETNLALYNIANELKNSAQANNQTQKTVQKLQESIIEIRNCCSKKQADGSAQLVAAQQEITKLKMEIENLKSKCARKDSEIQDLQREISEKKSIEILVKELVEKFDVQVGKLDKIMNMGIP